MTDQEGAFSGRISDRPVAELFQWLHEARQTGVARFRTALGTATVWFRDGELVDADMGRFHQDAAVLRLMRIQDGVFEVEPKPVNQRRMIKQSTALLLAEGRQRAPRPGPSTTATPEAASRTEPRPARTPTGSFGKLGSGEYSMVRDDSRSRPRIAEAPASGSGSQPRRPPGVDTGAHTILSAKAPPRPPAKAVPAPEGVGAPSRATTDPSTQGRGPAGRRRNVGWSPTAGSGPPPEPAASPPGRAAATEVFRPVEPPRAAAPPEPVGAADDGSQTRSGRTRFMFGVTGPAADREPSDPPSSARAQSAPPLEPDGLATPRAPRFAVESGAVATPVPPEDSGRTESRRRKPRAVARAQVPFEPERTDRTLLRPGPLPPPPGQPMVLPVTGSQAIPIAVAPSPSSAIPVPAPAPVPVSSPPPVVATPLARRYEASTQTTAIMGSEVERPMRPPPAATPFASPVLIDEEYSHPISVPTVPSMGTGSGGTWLMGPRGAERPLPEDPDAEATVTMRAPDIPQERGPSLSGDMKAGGGTAHVGRYEVLLRLARGGMGTVYLCRVTGEGGFRRLFALKVIRDHLNTNQAYVQMLLEEARIASRLSHPNIVSIIDIDTFAGQHYLVMDYVEGCTFSELLKAHPKARPPELIVPIVLDSLTGLHAAHSMRGDDGSPHPIVHCDFSPQNMLVGVNGTCRLTDFGVSKAADALQIGPSRGKPGYLSPEQVRGVPLDPRSDIFSAGVVLWNALTGEQLFDGDDPQQVLHQVVSRKIPKPSTVGLRPPACFDRICMRALARDPNERYQSAEQMLTELRKVAIAEDLLAPSSAVGRWVQETFGAQIEMRRQAAGLPPNPVAALALRDLASMGPSGHSEVAHDGSVTGHDPDASMTMMLRAGATRDAAEEDREGLGARTRVVVIVASLAFIAAGVITLFVRPDLLQGGIIDERGQYIDLSTPPDREVLTGGETSPGPEPAAGSTGGPTPPPVAGGSEDTGTDTDDGVDASDDASREPPPADPKVKDKPGKGKGKTDGTEPKPDETKDDSGKGKGKGKGKGEADPGTSAPPPDLDELFRPPGG